MTTLLTVFVDGLKPESLEHMEFLDTFENKRRIKTELGYSNPCHASMYSGVYPNKHLCWFIWKYSPETSPFKWIGKLKLYRFPHNIYTKYLCYKISKIFNSRKVTSYYGIPFLWRIPINNWHYFDVAEKKFWSEPGYIENYPTIFEILKENNIAYEIVGMSRNPAQSSIEVAKHDLVTSKSLWIYYFIGDIDPLSHRYGQDSPQTIERLKRIDNIVEIKYKELEKKDEEACFLFFSDHGHIKVKGEVNLYSHFRSCGESLKDYIHFIDSNYARFWFRNEKERRNVERVLSELDDKGFILTNELLQKYHVDMPDNRYGDLIFYLDVPYVFSHGEVYVLGKRMSVKNVSMHGYLPDYPESDGVLVTSSRLKGNKLIKLEDITPSILYMFNIATPNYMDGEIIWK